MDNASSKKINRLFKKHFGTDDLSSKLQNIESLFKNPVLAVEGFDEIKDFFTKIPAFLKSTEESLEQMTKRVDLSNRSLKISSKELTDRNIALFSLTQEFTAIMNSMEQALFLFDRKGICMPAYSKSCERIFKCIPSEMNFFEVLKLSDSNIENINDWLNLVFEEKIQFEDLTSLLPSSLNPEICENVEIEYRAIRNLENRIDSILVIGTDKTREKSAKTEAEKNLAFANKIIKLVCERDGIAGFKSQFNKVIASFSKLHAKSPNEQIIELKRDLHDLKANCRAFYATKLSTLIHDAENSLTLSVNEFIDEISQTSISMQKAFNDYFFELEAILGYNFFQAEECRTIPVKNLRKMHLALKKNRKVEDLVEIFENTFLKINLKEKIFEFNDYAQKVAASLNKKILPLAINIPGNITILEDKISPFLITLNHVFSNAIDHAIEPKNTRISLGKNEFGLIQVLAMVSEQNNLILTISDDGKGIDSDAIRKKLLGRGKNALSVSNMSETEVLMTIFEDGFSTAERVSQYSGRGVGLASVMAATKALNGSIAIESKVDIGTKLIFTFPMAHLNA